jgi:hypothetical protein
MPGAHDNALQRALSVRLSLQFSLSSLPIVAEWMDIHLNRWLESVPLPPEMPTGHHAHFNVSLASDLSRMSWRAYGDPAGFVPKMARYFGVVKMSKEDTALLDAMGNGLEPELVGSWIAVRGDAVSSGWQFCDSHPFAEVAPLFADSAAKAKLMAWLAEVGVERFRWFAQGIGEHVSTDVAFSLPGVSDDDKVAAASRAFEALWGEGLPPHVGEAMNNTGSSDFGVAVRIADGEIARVAVESPGLGNDVIARLCADAGCVYDPQLSQLQGVLGADGADRVSYAMVRGADGDSSVEVDIQVVPTDAGKANPLKLN